jgi:hypothetical protein
MAIIKNYGLRWVRDQVNWGSAGIAGFLSGKMAKTSTSIDFQDQIGIYILYEPIFTPIYIGQAGFGNASLLARLRHHRNDHLRDRWTSFSWFGFRDVNKDGSLSAKQTGDAKTSISYGDALDEVEGVLIEVLEPRLNKQGAQWRKTANEYVQDGLPVDSERISRIESKLSAIHESLEKLIKH